MSHIQTVKDAYAAFAKGDIEAVLDVLDPKIAWVEPEVEGLPVSGTHHGPDEVAKNVFGPIPDNWESFEIEPKEFVDGGELIAVIVRLKAVSKKTGEKLDADNAHFWKFSDDKVVRFQLFSDTAGELHALHGSDTEGFPRRG
jgi:ketosteroid isomerase-like protein